MIKTAFVLLALASAPSAIAAPMTCAVFKDKLSASIDAAGNKVAQPAGYSVAFKQEDNPHIRYEFGGIADIRGDLNCMEQDAFQSIDFSSKFEDGKLSEYPLRADRLKALASASLCAFTGAKQKDCDSFTNRLYAKAFKSFFQEKKRGELHPGGQEYADYGISTQMEWSIIPGGVLVSISMKP